MYIHARLNAKSPFIFDIHFEITFKNAGLRVPGRIIVRNEKPKGSQTPRENEWFWFLDSGRRQWLLAQPFFIQNDLVEVKAMNSRVGRRKETTNFSTVILGSDQETLAKQSCCQEPSGKEGRKAGRLDRVAKTQDSIRSAGGNRRSSDTTDTGEAGTTDERKPSGQSFPICRRSELILYVKFRNSSGFLSQRWRWLIGRRKTTTNSPHWKPHTKISLIR